MDWLYGLHKGRTLIRKSNILCVFSHPAGSNCQLSRDFVELCPSVVTSPHIYSCAIPVIGQFFHFILHTTIPTTSIFIAWGHNHTKYGKCGKMMKVIKKKKKRCKKEKERPLRADCISFSWHKGKQRKHCLAACFRRNSPSWKASFLSQRVHPDLQLDSSNRS